MREMKDSGFQWIGSIPAAWNLKKLKYMVTKAERGTAPDYIDNEGTKVVNQATFSRGYFDTSNIRFSTKPAFSSRGLLFPNDILLASTGGGVLGKTYYYEQEEEYVADSHVTIIRTCTEILMSKFLYYFFAINYDTFNAMMAEGSTNQTELQRDLLINMYVPVPSSEEQRKIITLLDGKCAEIDSLISDIQTQIDTLEQYKRSVITEAITKGLNPDAEMKDSGIEWIGDIPTHWGQSRIGGLYSLRTEKVSDKDYAPLSVTMQGIVPQLESAAKTNDGDNRKLVRKGDFAINSRSDRRGSCGISDYDGSVSLINTVLTPRIEINPRYYNWLFHTTEFADEFYRWGHGIVDDLWTTGWQDMKKIVIPSPPIDEQHRIAAFLDEKCAEIDGIISDKKQQFATLDEYKKSLIYEYVTGKKEVPIA